MYRLVLIATLCIIAQMPNRSEASRNPNRQNYRSLGCWKDEIQFGKRAMESLEGKPGLRRVLNGPYKTRNDAVTKCFKAAAIKGYEVFAVQDGGQCFGSADAKETYTRFGQSFECSSMKGGPMANDVYVLTDLTKCLCLMPKPPQKPIGRNGKPKPCFANEFKKNSINRTALHIAARNGDAVCANLLIAAGAKLEAKDTQGKTALQLAAWKGHCETVGALIGSGANGKRLSTSEKAGVTRCNIDIPEASAHRVVKPYQAIGCYKDDIPRAINSIENQDAVSTILTGRYKTRQNAVQKCYLAAKSFDYKYFAVQDGGQCMSSPTAGNDYNKYGRYVSACVDDKGGPMANYVYKIK